jgi:hypothetical protein
LGGILLKFPETVKYIAIKKPLLETNTDLYHFHAGMTKKYASPVRSLTKKNNKRNTNPHCRFAGCNRV